LKINTKISINLLLLLALFSWIIYTPSHFQKGGVDRDFYYYIALFVTIQSFLITIRHTDFHLQERLLIVFPISLLTLFLTTIFLGPFFVELLYDDKTWFLWKTNHRILINLIYYGLNVLILILCSNIYFNFRRNRKLKIQ
jgi:ABC-type uncharacterized transport system permease subunit